MLWLTLSQMPVHIPIHAMHSKGQSKRYSQGASTLVKSLFFGGIFAVGLGGCFSGGEDNTDITDSIAQPLNSPSQLENKQTNVKITVPTDWISAGSDLRGSADIYARYPLRELYASVLSESDTTLEQFSLEDNADKYRWLIEEEMETYEGSTKTEVTQIDGLPAIQYEIRGRVDGLPVVYLHTTVKGTDSYYQVVGWTTADRYGENKDTLQTIISSFDGT